MLTAENTPPGSYPSSLHSKNISYWNPTNASPASYLIQEEFLEGKRKKIPFLIWHIPARAARHAWELVLKIINNYISFSKMLHFVTISDTICFKK